MKSAIILHGTPSKEEFYSTENPISDTNKHWLPWLQDELVRREILAQTPQLPKSWYPVYEDWKRVFEYFPVDESTTLVGHSCGGGFLVRWLSENNIKFDKLILVAPWLNPQKRERIEPYFFNFEFDPKLLERGNSAHVFISDDDAIQILDSVKTIKENISGIQLHEFTGLEHFTFNDMGTREFPELLEVCLS